MEDQVNLFQMQPPPEAVKENLNEQDLAAIGGGVSTAIALGTLRRSFSESDVTRLGNASKFGFPVNMSPTSPGSYGSDGSIEQFGRGAALIKPEEL